MPADASVGRHYGVRRTTSSWAEVLITLIWALAVTALPVVFHLVGQWAGILACVLLTLVVTCFVPASLPGTLIFCWVFQSLVVSIVSPAIDETDMTTIRAYSFLTTAVAWVVVMLGYWIERPKVSAEFRLLMNAVTACLVAIAVYSAIGMASNANAALIYLRSLATPFFLFQIFAIVAYRQDVSLTRLLVVIGIAVTTYGFAELLAHEALFSLVNGDHFMTMRGRQEFEAGAWLKEMQQTGRVMRSYLDTLRIEAFNTPLLSDLKIELFRLVGPNFHPISFAYTLAFLTLACAAAGQVWFLLLSIPLLLVIGSKGAVILILLVLLLLAIRPLMRLSTVVALCVAALAIYAVVGIVIGMNIQDYHVIGFIGGLNGFLKNPFGHGIGVGGNLSVNMAATIDWSRSQMLGQTDVAVESAVGVLLYQMGIAAAIVFATLLLIASKLLRIAADPRAKVALMCALSILTLCVNGIFQEEALFAPLALALMLGFSGFVLGTAYRQQSEVRVPSPRARVLRAA